MMRFDAQAYSMAAELFGRARAAARTLPLAIAHEEAARDMLGAQGYGASPGAASDGGEVERAAARHIGLADRLAEARREYEATHAAADAAVRAMLACGDGTERDANVLRAYYLLGLGSGEAADRCGYSRQYFAEVREVALVRVAPSVRSGGWRP